MAAPAYEEKAENRSFVSEHATSDRDNRLRIERLASYDQTQYSVITSL